MILAFSFVQFFIHGGFFMYLLLLCSIVSVATILLRAWSLRREEIIPPALEVELQSLSPGGDALTLRRIEAQVAMQESPLGRLIEIGLLHSDWPRQENTESIQVRARKEVMALESGLSVLEVIVGVAPLLGLLGAVSGLVTVFGELGTSDAIADPRGLAMGISEALNTTIAGLAIAIPSLMAYSYFSRRVEALSLELEDLVGAFVSKIYYQAPVGAASDLPGEYETREELVHEEAVREEPVHEEEVQKAPTLEQVLTVSEEVTPKHEEPSSSPKPRRPRTVQRRRKKADEPKPDEV